MREVLIGVALAAMAAVTVPVVALSHGNDMPASFTQSAGPIQK